MFRKMPKAAEVADVAETPGIAPETSEASEARVPRRPSVRPFYVGGPEVPGGCGGLELLECLDLSEFSDVAGSLCDAMWLNGARWDSRGLDAPYEGP